MNTNTVFSSPSKEQLWVDHISTKFIREVPINISNENPICVFNIPKSITIFKPEAYHPQVIALGPYHHMAPHLYHMERYKISCAKSSFNRGQGNIIFRGLLIDKLRELDAVVRGCYHSYLDFDDNTLSWIMAIDGLFLVNLLQYHFVEPDSKMVENTILSRDLMLLENQIPFIVLRETYRMMKSDASEIDDDESELLLMMRRFCQANSPLQVSSNSSCSCNETSHLHLLDLMYHLMVNDSFREAKRSSQDEEHSISRNSSEETEDLEADMNSACDNIGILANLAMKFGIGRKILKPVQVILNIPWDKLLNIWGWTLSDTHLFNSAKIIQDPDNNEGLVVKEISIPSVCSLHYYAGITFKPTREGITGIRFVEQEAALYLPIMTLDVSSEVIFRNLVAYETAMNYSSSSPPFAQFVDLLSGIIDSPNDARLLRENGIIKGELTNDGIAELFNGMNKTTKSSSNKIVVKINNYYKKRVVIRVFMFMKKGWLSLWKVMTKVLTVVLMMLLALYLFCEFYGCPKLFGANN